MIRNYWKKGLGGIAHQPTKSEMFQNNINLMYEKNTTSPYFLDFLSEEAKKEKIYFKYELTRRHNIVKIFSNDTDEQLIYWFFADGFEWLHTAIFNYWDNRCTNPDCQISQDELIDLAIAKRIRSSKSTLELHHISRLQYHVQNEKSFLSPLEMFEPRCPDCHPRGLEKQSL